MAIQTKTSNPLLSKLRSIGRKRPKHEIIESHQDTQDPSWTQFLRLIENDGETRLTADGKAEALELLFRYGQLKDSREKDWLIDQVVRRLAGNHYEDFVDIYSFDEDFGNSYSWSQGESPRSI